MPYKTTRRRGGNRKYRKRRSRYNGYSSKPRRRKNRVQSAIGKEIAEMKRLTEPTPYIYNWAIRYFNQQTGSIQPGYMAMIIPFLQWNDAYDIAALHNLMQTRLAQGNVNGLTLPLNKFAVGGYKGGFTIKNLANLELMMDLYTCVARSDTDTGITPGANWGTNGAGISYANYIRVLINSVIEQSGQNGGIVPTQSNWPVGVTPYDCNKFCTYVKILKCKRNIVIMGGGFKSYQVVDNKWRIWNGTKVFNANNAVTVPDVGFARRTKFVFGILRSQPVVQQGSSTQQANYGPINIVVNGNERYETTAINNASKTFSYGADVTTAIVNSNLSTMDAMTEIQAGYIIA